MSQSSGNNDNGLGNQSQPKRTVKQRDQKDFTQGSVAGNIFRIAGPMTLALLVNVLYSVVDRMYIGRMPGDGTLALTGIGLAFPIIALISAFQSLVSSGGPPLFSIANGQGDRKEAAKIQGNAFGTLIFLGFILMVFGYIFKVPILEATGADASTLPYADAYLDHYLLGTIPVMISLGMNPFINSQGHAKMGMITVIIGATLNIILDPIFIFVLGMGVRGAAIATVISQTFSAVWVVYFFTSKKTALRLRLQDMRLNRRIIGRMLGLGATGFTAQATNSAVAMVYNSLLSSLGGTIWVTAMTVISSLREIIHMPVQSITSGAQPVLGYNYGAGETERVRAGIRIVTISTLAYNVVIWVLLMLIPGGFVRIFNNDPDLLITGSQAIRIFYSMLPFMSLQMAGQATFVGLGQTRYAIFFSLLRKLFLVIPLAFILPQIAGLGVNGVFLSEPISDVVGGLACYITMYIVIYRKLGKGLDPRD